MLHIKLYDCSQQHTILHNFLSCAVCVLYTMLDKHQRQNYLFLTALGHPCILSSYNHEFMTPLCHIYQYFNQSICHIHTPSSQAINSSHVRFIH